MSKQVTIIGAGPGGLAAAMLLARAGASVTVYERGARVGGRTSSIESDGFRFDVDPTFFLYPRVLDEIYSDAGFDLKREVSMTRLDPQYRLVFGAGGELLATPNVERMERAIAALSPNDAPSFRRFLADNRAKLELFKPCLETPYLGWKDVLTPRMLATLPGLKPWATLDQDLRSYFKDERVRLSFSFQSKYLGMSPFTCPSLFSILSFLEYEYGVFHPTGGCGAVTENMARCAEALGVRIATNTPVREIVFTGRRATGVRTDQGVTATDAIVVNADFARAMTTLIPDRLRRRWSNAKIGGKRFSCSTFMLYLGVDGTHDLPHHNIYIARDYERNLREIERDHVLSDDPSVYVQNAGVTDRTLAPEGHSTLYVLVPVTHQHRNVDWSKERERFRAVALKQIAHLGFRDLDRRIRFERVVTPADWDTSAQIHLGATFNLAHSFSQMLHLRPRNRFEDVDGVYLVGGGTHPGSGLPVIFESARITSRLLANDLGFAPAWVGDVAPGRLAKAAG